MADILTSKLLNFPTPAEHKAVWYTWGPVLGAYEPLGVELLRDTRSGNWFIIDNKGTRSSTIPAFVAELATGQVKPVTAIPGEGCSERLDEEILLARVYQFMEWLMTMLKRHA